MHKIALVVVASGLVIARHIRDDDPIYINGWMDPVWGAIVMSVVGYILWRRHKRDAAADQRPNE